MERIVLLVAAAWVPVAWAQDAAQGYPARPVRIIVPFVAGGPTDVQARWAAQKLNQAWGQAVVVENRGGAGGVTGTDAVAKAAPDGYTLLGGNPGPLTVAPSIQAKLPYDPGRDLAPVALLATSASVLLMHPSVPARNLKEFVALARSRPGRITYGSPGMGTVGHFATELFTSMAGITLLHVPYKGAAQYVIDAIAGHIDVAFTQVAQATPLVREGKLRALGIAKLDRSKMLPEVPTIAEQGLAGFQSLNWTGLLAPAGTPRDIVLKLHAELAKHLRSPDGNTLAQQGFDIAAFGPDEYAAFLRAETAKWAKVAKVAGIKAE